MLARMYDDALKTVEAIAAWPQKLPQMQNIVEQLIGSIFLARSN